MRDEGSIRLASRCDEAIKDDHSPSPFSYPARYFRLLVVQSFSSLYSIQPWETIYTELCWLEVELESKNQETHNFNSW